MTDHRADKYSHTPRRVFDRANDRSEAKRQKISGRVRSLAAQVDLLQQQMELMRATLTEIHDRLWKK